MVVRAIAWGFWVVAARLLLGWSGLLPCQCYAREFWVVTRALLGCFGWLLGHC